MTRTLFRAAIVLAACHGAALAQRTVTDMAGRKVIIPAQVRKVYGMSPTSTVLMYTLAPEMLAGWNYQPDPPEMAMIVERFRLLPVIGGWYGKNNTGNLEEIIRSRPDLMLSMGDAMGRAVADRVQEQTHIPVVMLDGGLKSLPATYRMVGELLGTEARAAELADYCSRVIEEVETKVKAIPPARRRRYYYAEGPTGLETESGESWHSEALNFAGGVNVASLTAQQGGYGHTPVSMEQVLRWDPDLIISGYDHSSSPGEFYRTVWSDQVWTQLRAVKNREVYEAPQYPWNWVDRPPSVNRLIGIEWLAALFYPDAFKFDMPAETKRFYRTFYHRELSAKELEQLLGAATRKHL
jgi:iron complex transport system substrate-binding protein